MNATATQNQTRKTMTEKEKIEDRRNILARRIELACKNETQPRILWEIVAAGSGENAANAEAVGVRALTPKDTLKSPTLRHDFREYFSLGAQLAALKDAENIKWWQDHPNGVKEDGTDRTEAEYREWLAGSRAGWATAKGDNLAMPLK